MWRWRSPALPALAEAPRRKPVGLVHFAAARRGGEILHRECRFGDVGRGQVRLASVREALQLVFRAAGAATP